MGRPPGSGAGGHLDVEGVEGFVAGDAEGGGDVAGAPGLGWGRLHEGQDGGRSAWWVVGGAGVVLVCGLCWAGWGGLVDGHVDGGDAG